VKVSKLRRCYFVFRSWLKLDGRAHCAARSRPPFEAWPISFRRRENRTPIYLELNPEGKVPTLHIDGRPLTEVAAILFYIARRFPEAELLPEGLKGRRRPSR
jgi:glutathione S-transferase